MVKPALLLDENIGIVVASLLRERGYNVKSVLEEMPGITDSEILSVALEEKRLLVTLDKDFGVLVFRQSRKHLGVLFLRLRKESPEMVFRVLNDTLSEYGDKLRNKFVTITEYNVRAR